MFSERPAENLPHKNTMSKVLTFIRDDGDIYEAVEGSVMHKVLLADSRMKEIEPEMKELESEAAAPVTEIVTEPEKVEKTEPAVKAIKSNNKK